jgi:PAS domain S-box-containing protein
VSDTRDLSAAESPATGPRDPAARAEAERVFSDAMLESLPGVVYFYNQRGQFQRWNRSFERATGYSSAEIAGMHPLDFFPDEDRPLVRARIAEVFERGDSSVEARLRTRTGATIPYLFTGRRVVLEGVPCLVGMGIDIADRAAVSERLARSEQQYRELVELANSIILRWGADGRIQFLNEYGQRFFGYREEEIVGRDVLDTLVPASDSHGRDLQRLMHAIRTNPAAFEQNVNENERRNGERVWIAWTNRIAHAPDGSIAAILSVGTDITARVRADEALRSSESRYRTTLDSILEACQLIGFDWRYLYLNDAAVAQNRRPREEMLGCTVMECWPGVEQTLVFTLIERALHGRIAQHRELEFTFPDGTTGWFDVRTHPVPEGVFLLSVDITENKRAECALRDLNEQLERRVAERTAELREARERAESADRLKSAFLATMSHELRTPLNSIIGFTSIVAQGLAGPLNAEQTRQLGMVRSSARHLLDLINDVLDISKIEAGQLDLHITPFDLAESIHQAVQSVTPMAVQKNLPIVVQVPAGLEPVRSDRRRVEQVVLNLLSNAIKFTERGQISVTVAIEGETAPRAAIRVADTGIGIDAAGLAQLFQPFRQLDSGLARQHEGTGLGLAICHRLAGLLGGDIRAESEPGVGSVFTLRLPYGERGAA